MLFDIEFDCMVIDFKVGNFDDDFFELLVILRVFGVFDNSESGIVKFIVVVVVENEFGLEVSFFVSMDYFGYVYF